MTLRQAVVLASATLFSGLVPLEGQEARGTILGRLTDQTNAVLVGVKVEVTNTDTRVRTSATTNETGDYILPFLIPGPYDLLVEMSGFKKFVRPGIQVRVNERIAIDVTMEVGQPTESVRVVAEAPVLDTSTASMGQVIGSKTILDLPLKDGTVSMMAALSPGVLLLSESSGYVRPFDTFNPSLLSTDGTRVRSNSFQVDGAPNMQRGEVAYSPPPGVVDEVKIQTATFDASYGFMAGAAINMSLKSGTNSLHGQTYYFNQNPGLNANRFFLNRIGAPRLNFHVHRYGGNISGPLYLPKLYDGRNKTFWVYGGEGMYSFDPTPFFVESVPTPAQRAGDFSQLLAIGAQYQIYDPYSIRAEPTGRFSRQALAGNRIPANQLNPVSRKIADLWDLPNQAGTIDGTNNYTKGKNALDIYDNHMVRIDHNVSERQRFFSRVYITKMDRDQNERQNRAVGDNFFRFNRGFSFDHVYTVSPQFFINTRYSLTRFVAGNIPFQVRWDLVGLGFSPVFLNQIQQAESRALRLPRIRPTGYSFLSTEVFNRRHNDTHAVSGNLTQIVRSHTLRYGVEGRAYRENTYNLDHSAGSFDFDTLWTRGPLDTSGAAPIGQGFAAFLYGLPTSGYFPIRDNYAEQATAWAVYFQDDWKISRNLTLSFGLRWELMAPLTERFNRSVRGFDAASASPIEPQARANYARNPIPEVPVSQFQVRGGLTYAGEGGLPRHLWRTHKRDFMPRFGLAYSVTPKTVFRAGYGVYFEPIGIINLHVNQIGFSRDTDFVASLDNGQNFVANLTNPFASGLARPLGAAGGLSTNLGQGVSFFDGNLADPYMQRWQFALQRELPSSSVLEVSYVGNRGTRLRVGRQYNPIPRQYLSTSPVRDQTTINYLNDPIPNPFYPLLPRTSLAGTTTSRGQLLRPFPQFTSVFADTNAGYSWYHSMQVRFEKRFTRGLSSTWSYTWSKAMEAIGFLNETDPRPEEVISDQDRTHRLAVTWIYELPFGSGQRWASSGVASRIIGGWQVQGIYVTQSGQPLGFGNAIFFGDIKNLSLPGSQRTVDRWFNVDAGFERVAARQLDRNIRTLSSRFGGIRSAGQNNWDLSLIKNTRISERVQLQIRGEAINALNHAQFAPPNTTPSSTAFGRVTNEWSWPRVIQVGAKVVF